MRVRELYKLRGNQAASVYDKIMFKHEISAFLCVRKETLQVLAVFTHDDRDQETL